MKFCFIIENAWQIGGGDYAQFKYAEHLALRGHEVDVYGQFRKEFMDRMQTAAGLRWRFRGALPPSFRGAGRLNRIWGDLHARGVILPRFRAVRTRPDVVIGYSKRSAILADRLARGAGLPCAHVVFETPEWMSRDLGRLFDQVNVGPVRREWEEVREVYRRAAQLLPNSELTRAEVASWTGRPVAPAVYAGLDDPGPIRADHALGDYILYIGRLDVTKNVHDLIDAVARMKRPPRLVIAGRGHDELELQRRAVERGVAAEFAGHVSDAQKWQLIRGCRFLVFPTSFEGFGMPPGEALACGVPAVCSDIPILREVYGDHVEYFPLRDVEALAAVMEDMNTRDTYRRERGEAGRSYVLSRYTWSHCAERLENALRGAARSAT